MSTLKELAAVSQQKSQRHRCIICGAKVLNRNPSGKINTCSRECREARDAGTTRESIIKSDMDAHSWTNAPILTNRTSVHRER